MNYMKMKNQIQEILLDRYAVDIHQANMFFSTQNYVFVFPGKDYMIRVSIAAEKTRREILSELMWLDDLKSFASTICEPSPSLGGNLLEEFILDGTTYRAAMFRTARGNVKQIADMNPMFFICVGELLGKIHKVSAEEQELGMRFARSSLTEKFDNRLQMCRDRIPEKIQEKILRIQQAVEALPRELGQYGLCHGDFHLNNFFVEHNNIWVFDFDSCCYANYLYDIVSFLQSCLLQGYHAGEDMRKVIFEDILPWLRIGYELHHKLEDSHWDQLETFLAYRTAFTYLALMDIEEYGLDDTLNQMKQFFAYIMSQECVIDAMTQMMAMRKASQ